MPETNFGFGSRLKHAWNAFMNRDPTTHYNYIGSGSSIRPDRTKLRMSTEKSVVSSIFNRIAMDVSSCTIQHVRLDENGKFLEVIDDDLNYCLTTQTNIDQTAKEFFRDAALSMFDEGVVAIIPVDTEFDPKVTGSYKIKTLRTGKIVQWYPNDVKVLAYNDKNGKHEEITVPKSVVAIAENPFYTVMNEPNATLKRLIRKMNLLDSLDEESASGKLDLIIQLPYVIKSQARKVQAEQRRKDIENQLAGSKYGIAYTDGTEHITQLNRSVENNLTGQIETLTRMLYSQLGLTEAVFNGTASADELTNYYTRTVEPVVAAIIEPMRNKFITKTARSQGQSIYYFRDPFKFIPVNSLADIADKFTRNAIMTSNEFRQIIGMRSSEEPIADELSNKNMPGTEPIDSHAQKTEPISGDTPVSELIGNQ